jgi:hypothetical protein
VSEHTCDGAVDHRAVLELDGDRLVVQLHQEPAANPKSSTKLGEVRTERRSEGRAKRRHSGREARENGGRYLTSFILPVLAEGRREAAAAELKRGGSRRSYAVGFLGAGVNPSLKADLADGWDWEAWEAVRSGLIGPFFGPSVSGLLRAYSSCNCKPIQIHYYAFLLVYLLFASPFKYTIMPFY